MKKRIIIVSILFMITTLMMSIDLNANTDYTNFESIDLESGSLIESW